MLPQPEILWLINADLDPSDRHGTKMSTRNHHGPLVESQHYVIDPTNLCRTLHDGIQDRLHVRGRATDDAEHLGGCRLMFSGFTQRCVAFREFFEEAHVLDGDNRLRGESL